MHPKVYEAAKSGDSDSFETIISGNEEDIFHQTTPKENNILHVAAQYKQGNYKGDTPLHLAAKVGSYRAVRAFIDLAKSLHWVVNNGRVNACKELLRKQNLNKDTALHHATEGQSALHIAAFRGHINAIDGLITSCPDACDIINNKGQTALHVAVMGGQVSVVKYILGMPNREDLINEQDTNGNTALHLAALHKENDIIDILARDKRVDRLAKNKDHLTALDIFSAHEEIDFSARNVSYLLEGSHGISGFQAWFIEHGKKSIVDVQLLVAALIATVSFTAAVAMPGGYNNDGPNRGMAILAGRADFQAFVLCNSIAFLLSVLAIILHCQSCAFSFHQEPKYILTVGGCIEVAIAAMGLAYIFGMFTVLIRPTGSTAERVAPYIAYGFLSTLCFIYEFTDPEAHSWLLGSSPRGGYIRKFFTVIFGWAGSANQ
ncbi:protein ACCELERATED CELL DEATH 6 [Eucalyptus grandis]|uniref:protein ACCELERATED CELL DEATH 6 n=1 Tax=Eucalyptus grandis TaxID=71139 RepID=UPI00192E8CA8|nr:protein ACCELERATED CELL DEATH 6 [Eucalyptus grandis]